MNAEQAKIKADEVNEEPNRLLILELQDKIDKAATTGGYHILCDYLTNVVRRHFEEHGFNVSSAGTGHIIMWA